MTWKVIYTEQAERDLRDIYEYIAYSLLEPETAARQVRRIMDSIVTLNRMPMRHHLVVRKPWNDRGLRILTTDKYLAFYLPVEAQGVVAVIRIMYSGRDVFEQLTKTEEPT